MGKRTIDQWTWDYWLVQRYVILCYKIFYKKIYVNNIKNVPRDQPVILAPNHQNALMDALAFVCNTPFQNVFLARSDIFKGKVLIHFLNFLNITPIYRIRDGIDNVRRNDEVFDKTLQIFRNKYNPVCIFPEGNHGDKRKLRPLVKGIFRMAFMAQEDYKEKPGAKIIPVGLDYGHYQNFRTTVFINFGEPIEVNEYYSLYEKDKIKAINELKDRLAREMNRLMIDIRNEEFYDLYMQMRTIYNSRMREKLEIHGRSLLDKFTADKQMIKILDNQYTDNRNVLLTLNRLVNNYMDKLKAMNLRHWIVEKRKFFMGMEIGKLIMLFLLLPVYFLGLITNYIPYKIPEWHARKIKDPQFHSSFKFVLGQVLFPLYYAIFIVLVFLFIPGLLLQLTCIFSMLLSGIFAFNFYIWVKKLRGKFRFLLSLHKKNNQAYYLVQAHKEIVTVMDKIVDKYLKQGKIEF